MGLIHFLLAQGHNQFVGGGLVLMMTGSVMALARRVPSKFLEWAKRRVTVEVEVLNSDVLFDYLTAWLDNQPYSRRSRRLTATTANRVSAGDEPPVTESMKQLPRVFLSPAPGMHLFFYRGRLIRLWRIRDSSSAPTSAQAVMPPKHERYVVTILGRSQKPLRELIEEVVKYGIRSDDYVRIFMPSFDYWIPSGKMRARKLESVILPSGTSESLLSDCKKFLESAEWYRSVGIPWRRGYLLYGLPGTGKSSLVAALAGELEMDLYMLNIAGLNDDRLISLVSKARQRIILLLEDIDCVVPKREEKADRSQVTLSGLLNCLDGVQSPEGCITFMTSNAKDKLDSALIRPGRIDVSLEFGLATHEQILRLSERLAPQRDPALVLAQCGGKTMAEVQQILLDTSTPAALPMARCA